MPNLIVIILALGATGLFLALPGGRRELTRAGFLLLAAVGGTLTAIAIRALLGQSDLSWLLGCSLVAILAALRVITHPRPVYSALYFVLLVVAVTGLLVLMQAEFLAAALLLVYAGAILVTYVFVIMLAQQSRSAPYDVRSREPLLGCLAGFVLLTIMAAHLLEPANTDAGTAVVPIAAGTVGAVGTPLLTHYVIGVQIVGLLLLAALIGAIAIARRQPAEVTATEGED